ncbi:MAG TPA: TOBE domain-containing protein, partial [Candidatus Acetothermia bacterium]|nr:TOBE domain-containing protein [Candidatus Acetothermia bacterium]
FLEATIAASDQGVGLAVGNFALPLPPIWRKPLEGKVGEMVIVGIRAENITVHQEPAPRSLTATVLVSEPLGSQQLVTVQVGDDVLKVAIPPEPLLTAGQTVGLAPVVEKLRLFDKETGEALPAPTLSPGGNR